MLTRASDRNDANGKAEQRNHGRNGGTNAWLRQLEKWRESEENEVEIKSYKSQIF